MNAATNPEIWVVLDKDGYPVFTAGWKDACHEHINDAVLHDKSSRKWVVRQVAVQPAKTESVLIQGVAYTLPIEVACELFGLHIDLKTAQKDAKLGAAIMRACRDLPWGFTMEVNPERGNGDVVLFDTGFTDITPTLNDMNFAEKVNTTIDAAIKAEVIA